MTTVDIAEIKRIGPGIKQVTFHCWDSDTSNEITVAFVLEAQPEVEGYGRLAAEAHGQLRNLFRRLSDACDSYLNIPEQT